MWFVNQQGKLTDKDAARLSEEEWDLLADIVDIIGMFRPLTVSLEKAGDAAIVHVLPQLLRLTTKVMHKPAETAVAHSGRSIDEFAAKFGVDPK